jgi:CheY-like chemotaxis protein
VHGAVRRHGGSIQVDSAPGLGAKFTIELPLAVVTPGAAAEPVVVLPALPPPTSTENGPAVLVVDDEPTVGQLLVRMLASLGRAGEYLASGAKTLDRVDELPRDRALVVFVDLTMPEMDGAELIRRLRALRPDVRIVLMSGHTTDMLEQASVAQAPEAVLSKPFQLAAVRAALASALAAATTNG